MVFKETGISMNNESAFRGRYFIISLALHGLVIGCLGLFVGSHAARSTEPIVVLLTPEVRGGGGGGGSPDKSEHKNDKRPARPKAVAVQKRQQPVVTPQKAPPTEVVTPQPVVANASAATPAVALPPAPPVVAEVAAAPSGAGGHGSGTGTGSGSGHGSGTGTGSGSGSGSGVGAGTGSGTGDSTGPGQAKGESPETLKARYLKEHFAYIRDMILAHLSYPAMARKLGWKGAVTVSFVIREDGRTDKGRIVKSSGYDVLDRNVLETIDRVQPFPKPPVKAELVMPVVYSLE
jgi:periplasmic protein TonB